MNDELKRVAEAFPQDPHENVLMFRQQKVDLIDERLREHCRCRPGVPHTFGEVHLALEVCEFARDDELVRCHDGMVYMLEDLHDTTWLDHTCCDPKAQN